MQPSILSPVPVITFIGGELTIVARYHSEYGAPLEDAQVGVYTQNSSVAADVTIDGETITGVVKLDHIQTNDSKWSLGDDLTLSVRTKEQSKWSETRTTEKTCGEPVVKIATGGSTLVGFPHEINWTYQDYEGFYQCKYELRLKTLLMGTVRITKYASEYSVTIDGSEIAYACAIGGTEQNLPCELEVWSTSGLSKVSTFNLAIDADIPQAKASAQIKDGTMVVESANPFFLYVLSGNTFEQCAYASGTALTFSLPIVPPQSVRYFVVTLNEDRFGRADEIKPSGFDGVPRSYFDYYVDGIPQRIELLLDQTDDASVDSDIVSYTFAGRKDPVVYKRTSSASRSVSCVLLKPLDVDALLESLRGTEGVYRSSRGDIIHCFVESVSLSKRTEPGVAGDLDMSLQKVDGSPYRYFYQSPFFSDERLYPGDDVYPGTDTWMMG